MRSSHIKCSRLALAGTSDEKEHVCFGDGEKREIDSAAVGAGSPSFCGLT